MKPSRLILGTVQIGLNYGINNTTGRPEAAEVKRMVDLAIENGVTAFDTAPEYGDSEKILGKAVAGRKVTYISKVLPTEQIPAGQDEIKYLDKVLETTRANLRVNRLPIYLFHRIGDVTDRKLREHFVHLKIAGLIEKLGASVDTPAEAEQVLKIPKMEVLEIPFSVADRRLLDNGFLKQAKNRDLIVLARSVLLQGLLLKKNLPNWAGQLLPVISGLQALANEAGISFKELALRYVLSNKFIDGVIVGQERYEQLAQNLQFFKKGPLNNKIVAKVNRLPVVADEILTLKLWPTS